MNTSRKLRTLILFALILSLTSLETGLATAAKKKKQALTGTPILWQRPDDISSRDLFLGPGGAALAVAAPADSRAGPAQPRRNRTPGTID